MHNEIIMNMSLTRRWLRKEVINNNISCDGLNCSEIKVRFCCIVLTNVILIWHILHGLKLIVEESLVKTV